MEIKELKDLEVMKSALENYVQNTEKAIQMIKDNGLHPIFITDLEVRVIGAKRLLEKTNSEMHSCINKKVQEKIEKGEIINMDMLTGHMKPKWLYRLESTDSNLGLWYNEKGDFVLTLAEIENCETKDLPMGFDERYKQDGKDWFSSCSDVEDLTHWYSIENAKDLIKRGFRFSKYLATDYVEYEKETVFLKETCLDRVTLNIDDIFNATYEIANQS